MSKTGIVFPHQLFEDNVLLKTCDTIYLVEEWLFFKQYNFHKRKIAFHRASMKCYAYYLSSRSIKVIYIESNNDNSDIRKLIPFLKRQHLASFAYLDTTDYWLEKRITETARTCNLEITKHPGSHFLNSPEDITSYFSGKKSMFQTAFYKHQRKSRNILMMDKQNPAGGKWSYDGENRLKYPGNKTAPKVEFAKINPFCDEAIKYTNRHFGGNYGVLNSDFIYPVSFAESRRWLHEFFENRFRDFGTYEDAIVNNEHVLNHSLLSPMLNSGLLTPQQVIEEALKYAENNDIPINSLEGFIRQVIGWREFIRAVYQLKGKEERTRNYWGFTRKIPASFWNGTTGIEPVDITIKKVLQTGYCHHIERLMVLGNFMLLCEFDPDEVYRWFMELFIDSYDWAMVPNVYGMSQFADGGLVATKPYISGSNYLLKMSNYKRGAWQQVWDGLFWRFMHVHRDYFLQNPRLGMLVNTFDKMDAGKKGTHLANAEKYLVSI